MADLYREAISTKSIEATDQETSDFSPRSPTSIEKGTENTIVEDQLKRPYTRWQWLMVLGAIYSSQFLYGLDNTIVADIQGAVIEDLGEVENLGWLGVGFPLGSVATILTFGKAYGIFDMKWLYIGSMVMFTAGSALCGAAPNMTSLIIGRVWAGAGGAGMYLGVLNLISVSTSMTERSFYISISGIVWGVGCVLGPVIGGLFADSPATWRWAFYLNLVLFGLFSPVLLFVLSPFSFQPNVPFWSKIKRIDWAGVVLNAAMFTLFVVVLTFAGAIWPWDDNRMIVLYVVFGVVSIAFVASQYFMRFTTKTDRLFPGDFLLNKTLVLLYICQSTAAATLFVPIYYIPLFFQFVRGDSGIQSAVRLLPLICIGVGANMLQGALMPRFGYYMPWFLLASLFGVAGGALFYAAVDMNTSNSAIYGYSVVLGLGAGLSQQAAYSVAPTEVGPNRIADAIGFINTAQIGSNVIALTVTSVVFQNVGFLQVSKALNGLGFSASEIKDTLTGQRSVVYSQASEDVQQRVTTAVLSTINKEYLLVIAAGALGIAASLLLRREKLTMSVAAGG